MQISDKEVEARRRRGLIRELERKIRQLKRECAKQGHVVAGIPDPHDYEEAHCDGCGKNLGWYCPDSPDHYCSYPWNDSCDYCGKPRNRDDAVDYSFYD